MITTSESKDAVLIKYLLKELSPPEIEELEDELILDDELFERMQVVEMTLVDSYVRKEMLAEEQLRFENGFLATVENRYRVTEAQIYHKTLRRWRREQAETQPTKGKERRGKWFPTFFTLPIRWAGVALLLLFVLIPLVLRWAYPYKSTEDNVSNSIQEENPGFVKKNPEISANTDKKDNLQGNANIALRINNMMNQREPVGDKDHNQ